MTIHTLADYVAPVPERGQSRGLLPQPGMAVCTCTATLESYGLTPVDAAAWMRTHTHHETDGARELPVEGGRERGAAVLLHDFEHVREEAALVQVRLWGERRADSPAIAAAHGVEQAAKVLARAVMEGVFTAEQLHLLDKAPRMFGRVLAAIDGERAR